MIIKFTFSLNILLALSGISYAQKNAAETLLNGMQSWYETYPQEKVYLQTDREKYAAGETIWLKTWCVVDNKPSFLSKIVYVSVSDATGRIIDKKMFSLKELSTANGLIDLDKNLETGTYTVNAYTLWMLNYPAFIFQKNIQVYGSDYKERSAAQKAGNNEFTFFPEGGNMVETVSGQLAYKAVNSFGLPIAFKGTIYAGDGKKLTDIQSQHNGMGTVEFLPEAGKRYTAKIDFEDGKKGEYTLPAALKEGISLQVNNSSANRIAVMVNRAEQGKEKFKKIFIIGQMNGVPVYKADFNIDEGESGASIPKKELPGGLMQITAFDSSGNPLAERLVLIENYNIFSPQFNTQVVNTSKRANNILTFKLANNATSALSVLVTDASMDTDINNKENIASSLLMSSDIKGYIHNPGYYFSNKNPETLKNLDLLLMTQGWRRFTWKQIKGEEEITLKYPIETYMNVKGLVNKGGRKEPLKNGFVTVITKAEDSTTILSNAIVTDKGEFIVDSLVFKQKAKISYEGTDNNKTKLPVDITIYPAHIDSLKYQKLWQKTVQQSIETSESDPLVKHISKTVPQPIGTGKLLQDVRVTAKKLSRVDSVQKEYVSPIYENSDQSLLISEKRTYLNIWQFLNESVPGFNVNPFQPGGVTYASFSRYDGLSLTDSEQGIKFFINEIPVDIANIDVINPSDVILVKVYKGATAFAMGAEAGAISVYTKKGEDRKPAPNDKVFITTDKIGYAVTREFYSPDYTLRPDLNKTETDSRIILQWQPTAVKNNVGEFVVHFHNNDSSKAFKVTVQGLDSKGQLIYGEQIFK